MCTDAPHPLMPWGPETPTILHLTPSLYSLGAVSLPSLPSQALGPVQVAAAGHRVWWEKPWGMQSAPQS